LRVVRGWEEGEMGVVCERVRMGGIKRHIKIM
jgi:hypothetical protein